MVVLYSDADTQLLEDSHFTVYSVTHLGEAQGLQVIDVKSIESVVSMQPHNHQLIAGESHFFLWEKIGLDVSSLAQNNVI
jgi:hypothetical protein